MYLTDSNAGLNILQFDGRVDPAAPRGKEVAAAI